MKYAILGPIELTDGERLLPAGGPQQVALLALLLVHANRAVSSDLLIQALWGQESPAGALKSLHVAISRLRKTLDIEASGGKSAVRTVAGGYLLTVRPGDLDAEVFQTRLQEGRHALEADEAKRARDVLSGALGMWRGPALAEVAYEEFAQPEIRRLEELRLAALEARVDCELRLGEHRVVIAELEALVANYPGRERLAAQLMLALYRCERQGDALDVYARTRAYLADQLGLEPGPSLQTLQAEILAQSPVLHTVTDQARDPLEVGAQLSARRRRVRFNIPLPLAHFAGRKAELDAIDKGLAVADRAVVTQSIAGLGGVGKSQLAARYVHQHADEYAIVAWIRAEDGGIADLAELAAELCLPVAQLTPAECAAGAVRWLSGCDERWLLVLDNVATPEQLDDSCPTSGHGQVLITTRDRRMAQFGPVLSVDVFDEQTAIEYLLATSGRSQDRDAAPRLAQALGCLPLALSHAAAYCAAGTSFDDYLELLGALPAAELFESHPETSYAQTVASTWQVSIQAAEREAPLARQVLTMGAHLAPDAIPRELFGVLLDDATTAGARKQLLDAFNALHRSSLAKVDDAAISVHRLLQKTIRDDALQRGDPTAALSALAAVAEAFPREHYEPQTWAQSKRLLPHALAISTALTTPRPAGAQLIGLLNSASSYLLWAEEGALDTATRASELARQILGPDDTATLTARGNLALSLWAAGRIDESLEVGQQLLADRQRVLGDDHPDTLNTLAHLVISYRTAGRTKEAIELGERALRECERVLGPKHASTLTAGIYLTASYRAAGRTGQAIKLGERVLADIERNLGPQHPETLHAAAHVAACYWSAGRTIEAIELGERVLAEIERNFGHQHLDTLRARCNLAASYRTAGRIEEAIDLEQHVLADRERILGEHHPETMRARAHLATSYRTAGRIEEAIDLEEQVFVDREQLLGPEHIHTLSIRTQLAASYRAAGRTTDAQAIEQHARSGTPLDSHATRQRRPHSSDDREH